MSDYNLSKLETAITLQSKNQLDMAEKIYEEILTSDGKNFNALYLLGTIKAQKKKQAHLQNFLHMILSLQKNTLNA
jgi:tetratricopeptide (TPR) repeat protein